MSFTPLFAGSEWYYQQGGGTAPFQAEAKAWLNKITFTNATTMVPSMRIGKDAGTDPSEATYTGCFYNIFVNGSSVTGNVTIGDSNQFPSPPITVPSSGTFTIRVYLFCRVVAYSSDHSATIDVTFTVRDITSPLTFVNENTELKIFRLPPPATSAGKVPTFIKNTANIQVTFVHSNAGEAIDGATDGYVQLYPKACIGFSSSASQWYIASYYQNALLPTSATTGGTPITSACVLVDFVTANKTVSLPNPATWGKGQLLCIGLRQAGLPNAGNYTCSIVTNGYLYETAANAITISITNVTLTGGILLITDGTLWYIAGMSNGSEFTYALVPGSEGRPTITAGICFVQTGSNDGVTPPDVSSLASDSMRVGFVKLSKNAPFANGIVLQGSDVGLGQINYNKVFKTAGVLNYSGVVCLFGKAANTGATYALHPLCTYPSAF